MGSGSVGLCGWLSWCIWGTVSMMDDVTVEDGEAVLNLTFCKLLVGLAATTANDQIVAVVPSRIVPHISLDHVGSPGELVGLVEQVEPIHQPLAVAPNVVILRVLLQHVVYEVGLARWRAKRVDDGVPVVPDLVVLEMLERRRVEPCDFVLEGDAEFGDCLCAVQPTQVSPMCCMLCIACASCGSSAVAAPAATPPSMRLTTQCNVPGSC
jgi:hypothetical protein